MQIVLKFAILGAIHSRLVLGLLLENFLYNRIDILVKPKDVLYVKLTILWCHKIKLLFTIINYFEKKTYTEPYCNLCQ